MISLSSWRSKISAEAAAAAAARTGRLNRLGGGGAAEHSPASDAASAATSGAGAPAVDRAEVCFVAETCASAKLWEKMAAEIELLVEDLARQRPPDLLPRERELFFAAWQGLIAPKRHAWLTVTENLLDLRGTQARGSPRAGRQVEGVAALAEYASNIEDEIRLACQQCLGTLQTLLGGAGVSTESAMFYRQMQGDAIRYQLEVTTDAAARAELTSDALAAYTQATEGVNAAGLAPTNPVRLGLALNFAVFHHTTLNEPREAVRIAKEALEAAVEAMDGMEEETFAATTRSMKCVSCAASPRPCAGYPTQRGAGLMHARVCPFFHRLTEPLLAWRMRRQLSDALRAWGAAPRPGGMPAQQPRRTASDFADRERRREYGARSSDEEDGGESRSDSGSAASRSDDSVSDDDVDMASPVSPGR